MLIGDLARRTGVKERLLRYYEEQGLLHPARTASGYRRYAERDAATVRHIRLLLDAGLSTAAITRVLHCVHDDADGRAVPDACPVMVELVRRERARTAAEIARLRATQHSLDRLLAGATGQFA
jgi:DNA-binding transcriptional MerR regulator